MKTLTIRNLPDDLHSQLKDRARHNCRSLNGEVVAMLLEGSESNAPRRLLIERIDANRKRMGGPVWTVDDIEAAIQEGRE